MIDTHVHLIAPERFDYPWLSQAPGLKDGHNWDQYWSQAKEAGIKSAIFMEVDVAERDLKKEAAHFCQLADSLQTEHTQPLAGIIASARPEHTNHHEWETQCANAHARVIGFRRVLHTVENGISESKMFRQHVAGMADRGFSFDLCLRANQLPLAESLCQDVTKTSLVLDHCGNPPLSDANAMRAWQEQTARLATFENLSCKLSGLINHVPAGADGFTVLKPVVDHLLKHFGDKRICFGSDWPVSRLANCELSDWAQLAKRLTAHLPQEACDNIFEHNTQTIYPLTKT